LSFSDYAEYLAKFDPEGFQEQFGPKNGGSNGNAIDNRKKHPWEINLTYAT